MRSAAEVRREGEYGSGATEAVSWEMKFGHCMYCSLAEFELDAMSRSSLILGLGARLDTYGSGGASSR